MENLINEFRNVEFLKQQSLNEYNLKRDDLVKRLIDEFGLIGFKIVFEQEFKELFYRTTFHEKVPKQFAWPHNFDKQALENIDKIFKCSTVECGGAVLKLKRTCERIFPITLSDKDYLVYYLKIRQNDSLLHPVFLIGGAPIEKNTILGTSFNLPQNLLNFYSVHNGFGRLDQTNIFCSPFIKPLDWLEIEPFRIENNQDDNKPSVIVADVGNTCKYMYLLNGRKVQKEFILEGNGGPKQMVRNVFQIFGKLMDAIVK